MSDKENLVKAIDKLLRLKAQCHMQLTEDVGISDMSFKQLSYIKHFDHEDGITTSKLAEELNLTKPTVTEMVKKFIRNGFVYKESCPHDGRVYYLKLTDKGMKAASINKLSSGYLAERLTAKLNREDLIHLTEILNKIE